MEIDNIKWGGSGIEKCVYEYLIERFPKGTKMLEFGAGDVSTKVFSQYFQLTTIEQMSEWIGKYNSNYIHAPLFENWYDRKYLLGLPKDFEIVFVDGPLGDKRQGILEHLDLFNTECVWLFHDIYRPTERKLALDFATLTNKKINFFETCDYWAVVE